MDEKEIPTEGVIEHTLTAEDLALNEGALEEAGLSEGDVIDIPEDEITFDEDVAEDGEFSEDEEVVE